MKYEQYTENRTKMQSGMLPVDSGDFLGLVHEITRSMGAKVLPGNLGEDVEKILKELTWKEALYVVHTLMRMGKRTLYDKLYINLLELVAEVKTKKTEISRAKRFEEEVAPKFQCGRRLVDLQGAVVSEIVEWHKHTNPPLVFRNIEIVRNVPEKGVFEPIPNIDEYVEMGSPKTWSPLLDFYLSGYYKILHSTEGYGDTTRMEEYLLTLLKVLQRERNKQISEGFAKKRDNVIAALATNTNQNEEVNA